MHDFLQKIDVLKREAAMNDLMKDADGVSFERNEEF
jgi:hypothetical protein